MNQNYFKNLIPGITCTFLLLFMNADAQRASQNHARDRVDLVANVTKVQMDHKRINQVKKLIDDSRTSKNQKALKVHLQKLAREKAILKKDYASARQEENTYFTAKSLKIKKLENDLKASNERYQQIRKQIKK